MVRSHKKFDGLNVGDVVFLDGEEFVLTVLLLDGWTRIATPRIAQASLGSVRRAEDWEDFGDPVYYKCLVPTGKRYKGTWPIPQDTAMRSEPTPVIIPSTQR